MIERLRAALSGARSRPPGAEAPLARPPASETLPPADKRAVAPPEHSRRSHGLEQFVSTIREQPGLTILDLGEVCQPNVSFVTNLGHRLCSEDLLRTLDSAVAATEDPADPRWTASFLEQSLSFPAQHFDGALAWDTLQYLPPRLLAIMVERLHDLLRPQSCLLAFFHAEEKAEFVPMHSYRIRDERTLILTPRGRRKPAHLFNNREIEKLFQRFHPVKFFLTRDHLREVIVKR